MPADPLGPALDTRRRQSLWRERRVRSPAAIDQSAPPLAMVDGQRLINFCSNDYLGLSQHPEIIEASIRALRSHGTGSGAAALITGYTDIHACLEAALAQFCGRPRALLFPSGYQANLGMVGALAGPGVHVFEDRLNHASLLDGALLARARLIRYDHADPVALQQRLAASTATQKLVLSEGVFSMDGDIAPLPALAQVCREHAAVLCVDDAHGFGVLGNGGRGSEEHHAMTATDIPIFVATFGKALGCSGAFVAGDDKHVDALIQYARTYIYTTSMPPANAAAVLRALQVVTDEPERRAYLLKLISRFREIASSLGLAFAPSTTAIQPFVVGSSEQALRLSDQLREAGFWVTAIRPPTVAEGSARLRITLTAAHRETDIEALLKALHTCIAHTGVEPNGGNDMSSAGEQDRHYVDKRRAGASFGAAAASYEQSAVLQANVRSRLLERLDLIKLAPNRVVDLGAGTGAAARHLARRYRRAQILSMDISEQMLVQARSNAPLFARRREYVCADAECLPLAAASTEFVFSNMALQWCNNLDSVFTELSRILTPGGLVLFASLGPDTLQELRETWANVDQHTHVNAFIDMHDLGDALIRAGFSGPVMDVEHFTLTYESLAELMRDLKAIGAHNVTQGRPRGLLGRRRWNALNSNYEKFRRGGRLPCTYEVVYGHAWAPQAGARAQDGSTVASFAFDDLRKTLPGRATE